MTVIGLTGGIASGKSTVTALLKEKGAAIIDADKIAREIMSKGEPAWFEVLNYFGDEILNNDRSDIDRKKLAHIVFSDKAKLEVLNNITHPKIIEEIKRQVEEYKKAGKKIIVIDAALLIETGLDKIADEVWVVAANEDIQLQRLMAREKDITKDEALKRIKSQMPLAEKLKFADRVIDNNSSIEETKKQVDKIWTKIS
ncbi:dephospho-CoA kinase [Tepidanaerobacter syntrophicus]|uniref:dephospho-CoA kinase n=1 Tax=Tepidanaerobacter syntrophicus TaxID=224999 RepID=UPI00176EF1A4|nr:dephospho-CoA kinase [Tepidanaerobacter syntrophicus]GLI50451.1 dephospho-CoA kinase [Tepidanaerobacter syntrophicus]HHV83762.1 dephospho-CoA kinase [Tepidanaerobacter syntrophicus]